MVNATPDWVEVLKDLGVPGLVGVALGAALGYLAKRQERKWQREHARHTRELAAAEALDDALVEARRAIDGRGDQKYASAHKAWNEGWVRYSPRIRNSTVIERYDAVGSMLLSYVMGATREMEQRQWFASEAINNARITLGYFMRDQPLPSSGFPNAAELIQLLEQGRRGEDEDPFGPLLRWLEANPMPAFHLPSDSAQQTL